MKYKLIQWNNKKTPLAGEIFIKEEDFQNSDTAYFNFTFLMANKEPFSLMMKKNLLLPRSPYHNLESIEQVFINRKIQKNILNTLEEKNLIPKKHRIDPRFSIFFGSSIGLNLLLILIILMSGAVISSMTMATLSLSLCVWCIGFGIHLMALDKDRTGKDKFIAGFLWNALAWSCMGASIGATVGVLATVGLSAIACTGVGLGIGLGVATLVGLSMILYKAYTQPSFLAGTVFDTPNAIPVGKSENIDQNEPDLTRRLVGDAGLDRNDYEPVYTRLFPKESNRHDSSADEKRTASNPLIEAEVENYFSSNTHYC